MCRYNYLHLIYHLKKGIMEQLKEKIEQWFIDNDVPESAMSVVSGDLNREYNSTLALWYPKNMSHMVEIGYDEEDTYQPEFSKYWCCLWLNKSKKLTNQTEENIFSLLSCLVNHIK